MFAFQCVIPIIVVEKRGVKKNGMRGEICMKNGM